MRTSPVIRSHSTLDCHGSGSSTVSVAPSASIARSDTPSNVSRWARGSPGATPPRSRDRKGKHGKAPTGDQGKIGKQGKVGANNQIISTIGFGGPKITPELYAKQFPDALPLESEVFCWYPARGIWYSATIIHARPAVGASVMPSGSTSRSSVAPSIVGAPSSLHSAYLTPRTVDDAVILTPFEWEGKEADYDYYIHFHGEDRRQDMWVVASLLRPNTFDFHPYEPCAAAPAGPDEIHKHMDVDYLHEHEENTKLKTIGKVMVGEHLVDAWYFSPYPKEFQNLDVLYICEYCLTYFKYESELESHSALCGLRCPPGDEIYRDKEKNISVFEVDGLLAKAYTENLCFLSKLFLDHKTLRHPVHLFLFYVVTERYTKGHRLVGYFSKEKYSKNNLSCIMCLPQRKGYGQFLINLSYALSRKEGKRGTPERPLSDLGKATYVKYWSQAAVAALLSPPLVGSNDITLEQISHETSIEVGDIAFALEAIGVLRTYQVREGIRQHLYSLQNSTFIFLPNEHLTLFSKWSRTAFVNRIVPPILELSHTADPALKAEERPVPKVAERRSKRRRTAIDGGESREWDFGKRVKIHSQNESIIKQDEANTKTSQFVPPINLADLHWASYDLHLGALEYSPLLP